MKLVPRDHAQLSSSRTFDWVIGKKKVATVTIYADGLIEFSGKGHPSIAIEGIAGKAPGIVIDQVAMTFS